ncbi:MAG: zinc ABC transporter substrate-binding protein [Dysgonamonadaceae bacterium]|jgi:zinc transport system substrate-binding protein|nr:zinc ABC transporter substrate-binding protein [Dysgonamonadaceae bacterium]
MNKFYYPLVLLFTLCAGACSKQIQRKNILTVTIEPQRYFAERLVDTLFSVTSMVAPGINPETYDPAPAQIAQLAHSKAYFGIGPIGFENAWLDNLKKNNPGLPFFDNSRGIDWIVAENDDSYKHRHPDPHIWTSPKGAAIIARNMYEALSAIDPDNEPVYRNNLEGLLKEIDETAKTIQSYLDNSVQKAFIIYHPALTYFARDYGLTQYAMELDGKEPAPGQLKKLVDLAKEKNITTIFIQQEFDQKNVALMARETGCRLITINPLSYNWSEEIIRIAKSLSDE